MFSRCRTIFSKYRSMFSKYRLDGENLLSHVLYGRSIFTKYHPFCKGLPKLDF